MEEDFKNKKGCQPLEWVKAVKEIKVFGMNTL